MLSHMLLQLEQLAQLLKVCSYVTPQLNSNQNKWGRMDLIICMNVCHFIVHNKTMLFRCFFFRNLWWCSMLSSCETVLGHGEDYQVQLAVGQCPRSCIHYVTPSQRIILEELLDRCSWISPLRCHTKLFLLGCEIISIINSPVLRSTFLMVWKLTNSFICLTTMIDFSAYKMHPLWIRQLRQNCYTHS